MHLHRECKNIESAENQGQRIMLVTPPIFYFLRRLAIFIGIFVATALLPTQTAFSQQAHEIICEISAEFGNGSDIEDQNRIKLRIRKIVKTISDDSGGSIKFKGQNGSGCIPIGEYNIQLVKFDAVNLKFEGTLDIPTKLLNDVRKIEPTASQSISINRQAGGVNYLAKTDKDYILVRSFAYYYAINANVINRSRASLFCTNPINMQGQLAFKISRKIHGCS